MSRYFQVYVALLALLAVTFGVAHLNLGHYNGAVSLAIAAVKVALVGWFFMRVGLGSVAGRLFAWAGFLWLGILITLVLNDSLSRGWLPMP